MSPILISHFGPSMAIKSLYCKRFLPLPKRIAGNQGAYGVKHFGEAKILQIICYEEIKGNAKVKGRGGVNSKAIVIATAFAVRESN